MAPAVAARPPSSAPGGPSPRSPTLSDAAMILPEHSAPPRVASPEPPPSSAPHVHVHVHVASPASPTSLLYSHSNRSTPTLRLGSIRSARSSTPGLHSVASAESLSRKGAAASPAPAWPDYATHAVAFSADADHAKDADMAWPGFDGPVPHDDSGVVLDDAARDAESESLSDANADDADDADDDVDHDRWLDDHDGHDDSDPFSSAALSRRAELILANAKRRLNVRTARAGTGALTASQVMEGNLRGARHSLLVSPSASSPLANLKTASELSQQLSASRDRDRKLYAGIPR